jgi:hypothetical protein
MCCFYCRRRVNRPHAHTGWPHGCGPVLLRLAAVLLSVLLWLLMVAAVALLCGTAAIWLGALSGDLAAQDTLRCV